MIVPVKDLVRVGQGYKYHIKGGGYIESRGYLTLCGLSYDSEVNEPGLLAITEANPDLCYYCRKAKRKEVKDLLK